jgi:uncharacterized protein DUF1553/uncharacterized protein DUF1549/cytochrome c
MSKRTVIKSFITLAVGGIFLAGSQRQAQTAAQPQEPSREGLEFFEKKIRPALAENCYACHSEKSKKPRGGLQLDSIEAMLKGGASGQPAIVPGDPEKSLLIKAIRHTDAKLQMPMGGKLPDQVIKDFEAWVKMGAPAPRGSSTTAASNYPSYNFDEARKFWSFQPLKDHQPPKVKNGAWVKSPIDRFILAKLEEKGLKPVADADKRSLIRRATFDLTGLPPAPEEVEAFLKDTSPNAFEKVVDRLLGSQAYGEKWGRHWLDVVRYADTAGDNSDYPVIAAYRYRNYVIESFNKDKAYDQFIREQIAGDILAKHGGLRAEDGASDDAEVPGAKKTSAVEIDKSRQEKIIATGYLAISRRFGSRNKEMNLTIDDTIDNLGKTFLGLSVSCARCHDHKFDPIPQRDYYALYGIFNSIRYSFPGAEIYPHPAEMVALVGGKEAENFYMRQNELSEIDDAIERLKGERGAAARNKKLKEEAAKAETPAAANKEAKPPEAKRDNETGAEEKNAARKNDESLPADFDRDLANNQKAQASKRMPDEVEAEWTRVHSRQSELHARYVNIPKAYAVIEAAPANARVHRKGDPKSLGDEVPRGFLTILSPGGGRQVPKDHRGSGREFLADWIADAKNPLTARVMVNRIWAYHFGKGIVQTPNDLGARGRAPTHPELLDWLASRFIEGGWSIKKMHRSIMLSHAYRIGSGESAPRAVASESRLIAANSAIDVNNDYLWRFNRRRLEAEEIRDSVLAVSGSLDRTMGGEHPFPPESTWRFSQHEQFFAVYDTNRRSVYVMQQRLKRHPFFEVFDGADSNATTDSRAQSVTPVQALFLMNSPFIHEQSERFAVRVGMAYDTLRERIDYAFRLAYGRAPRLDEIREAQNYLRRTRLELKAGGAPVDQMNQKSLASYLRVVMSSNEFLYVD